MFPSPRHPPPQFSTSPLLFGSLRLPPSSRSTLFKGWVEQSCPPWPALSGIHTACQFSQMLPNHHRTCPGILASTSIKTTRAISFHLCLLSFYLNQENVLLFSHLGFYSVFSRLHRFVEYFELYYMSNKFLSSWTILSLKGICEVLWWFSTLIFYNQALTCFYPFYTRLISCLN